MRLLSHPYVIFPVRSLLATIFLFAAIGKLRHPQRFVYVVLAYRILPKRVAIVFARLLPWIEASVVTMLFLGVAIKAAVTVSSAMLLSFIFAAGINLKRRRKHFNCGCFSHSHPLNRWILIRNFFLLLLATAIYYFDSG
jgi:uncharacterized membrane protein YphA (DoxX/SURF4 family)